MFHPQFHIQGDRQSPCQNSIIDSDPDITTYVKNIPVFVRRLGKMQCFTQHLTEDQFLSPSPFSNTSFFPKCPVWAVISQKLLFYIKKRYRLYVLTFFACSKSVKIPWVILGTLNNVFYTIIIISIFGMVKTIRNCIKLCLTLLDGSWLLMTDHLLLADDWSTAGELLMAD